MLVGSRPMVRTRAAATVTLWAVPGFVVGAALVGHISRSNLQIAVGVAVVAAVLARAWHPGVVAEGRRRSVVRAGAGLASGVLTTTISANGPPLALWLDAEGVPRPRDARHAAGAVRRLQPGGGRCPRRCTSCPRRTRLAMTALLLPGLVAGTDRQAAGSRRGCRRPRRDGWRSRSSARPAQGASSQVSCSVRPVRPLSLPGLLVLVLLGRRLRRFGRRERQPGQIVTVTRTVFTTPGKSVPVPADGPLTSSGYRAITAGLRKLLGRDPLLLEVGLYDEYAYFRVYDKTTGFADDYNWRDGVFAPPAAVQDRLDRRGPRRCSRWRRSPPDGPSAFVRNVSRHRARRCRRRHAVREHLAQLLEQRGRPRRRRDALRHRRHAPVPVGDGRQPRPHHRAHLQLTAGHVERDPCDTARAPRDAAETSVTGRAIRAPSVRPKFRGLTPKIAFSGSDPRTSGARFRAEASRRRLSRPAGRLCGSAPDPWRPRC